MFDCQVGDWSTSKKKWDIWLIYNVSLRGKLEYQVDDFLIFHDFPIQTSKKVSILEWNSQSWHIWWWFSARMEMEAAGIQMLHTEEQGVGQWNIGS